jgi:hypothetical protein
MSSAARRSRPILPWSQLALLLAACGLGVWFLLPDEAQLIENLLRDGSYVEARRALGKVSAPQRAARATYYRLLEAQLDRLEHPLNSPAAINRFWAATTRAWRDTHFDRALFRELVPVLPSLPDPAAAWSAVAPDFARAPAEQRTVLQQGLVRAALAANRPADAAEIFAAPHSAPRAPADSLELSRLWQLAGRPAEALAALGDSVAPSFLAPRTALLRALNRNREALALLLARTATTPADAASIEELSAVALAAGAPAAAAPSVQRYLDTHPADLAAHRRLRDLFLAAGQPAAALASAHTAATSSFRAPADLAALARIYEYTTQPALAFDTWLALVLAPVPPPDVSPAPAAPLAALDRLIALNPGLYRDADLARALTRLVPVPGRPDYTLRLARLAVSLGQFDEARTAFERYLADAPADVDALIDLAHLHRELYRFADAETVLRRAAALRPADLLIRREIAETLVAQNRHVDALALYRELAADSTAEDVLGPYIRLAESLGRYDDFTRGLRRQIDASPTPAARDFVLLAYGYELADDPVRRQAALDEGLRRTTQSDDLRLQLAFALSAEKKYVDAQAALTPHAGLHADAAAATLYLELLRLNNDRAAERRYLAKPLAPALAHDESILERLARAREALREFPAAESLWRELIALRPVEFEYTAALARVLLLRRQTAEANRLLAPFLREPTPAILKLAAEIASAAGDHRSAEKYQLGYLAAVRAAPATDWGALGDIRLSRGDRTGAKRAYAEALHRLSAQLAATGGKP